jgi:hypothetical protein
MEDQNPGITVVTLTVTLDSVGTRHNVASMVKDLVVALEDLAVPLGIQNIQASALVLTTGGNVQTQESGNAAGITVRAMEHSELEAES